MPRVTHVQTNFTGGEWTPRLVGRTDISKYQNACLKLDNFIVQPHGGIIRRSGTRFVKETKFSDRKFRLIPFTFSNEQSYVIEFGNLYIRLYRDRGRLEPTPGTALEFVSPFGEACLPNISYTQSADILYLVESDVKPQELQRLADTDWQFVDFDFTDGPYLVQNTTTTTLNPSGTTGSITIVASSATGINGGDGFLESDVGRLIRLKTAGTQGYVEITAVTDSLNVTALVKETLGGTSATADWRLGAWSDTTGWPRAVEFHQERLWFGGTRTQPQTLWGSVVGDFTNFQPSAADSTVSDDDGVTFTLSDDRVNNIRWIVSALKGLIVGTSDGEFQLQSTGAFDPITPTNISANRQTAYGSRLNVTPYVVDGTVLFIQRDGRRVREFAFSFNLDQFVARDVTLLAEHITTSKIVQSAYQSSPEPIYWAVLEGGLLVGMTYLRQQEVVAWHNNPVGGSFQGGNAVVETVAVIPDDPYDLLWVGVKRTINGVTKRFVEFVEDRFDIGEVKEDAFYVDSGLTFSGASSTVISGLDHLEGESVSILANGASHPNKTVSGGSVTLDVAVTKAQLGLGFNSTMTVMPLTPERAPFDPRGKFKAIYRVLMEFHQTIGGKVGSDPAKLQRLLFRKGSDPMDSGPPLFTDLHEVTLQTGFEKRLEFTYQQDQPLPANLLNVIFEVDLGGS